MIEGDLLVNQHGNYQIYFKKTHRFIFLNSPLSLFKTSVPAVIPHLQVFLMFHPPSHPRMAPWVVTSGRVPNTTPKAATCSLSRERQHPPQRWVNRWFLKWPFLILTHVAIYNWIELLYKLLSTQHIYHDHDFWCLLMWAGWGKNLGSLTRIYSGYLRTQYLNSCQTHKHYKHPSGWNNWKDMKG